jgi:hypothetical protein
MPRVGVKTVGKRGVMRLPCGALRSIKLLRGRRDNMHLHPRIPGAAMARTAPTPSPLDNIALDAMAAYAEAGGQLFQQWLALQESWLAGWCSLQCEWARDFEARAAALPSWMVWHNGTEQLA